MSEPTSTSKRAPRKTRLRKALAALLIGVAVPLLVWPSLKRHGRAAGLLLAATGAKDPTGLTTALAYDVREREQALDVGDRKLRALGYRAVGLDAPPGIVLLHGVHPSGIDEPRFRRFARALAAAGADVITPELPELAAYRVEPTSITDIGACARAHANATGGPVGAWGISFAGGLLLIAAAGDAAPAFAYAVTVGAHDDLVRLARYYAGESVQGPDGERPSEQPNPYGARVILHRHAESFFAPENVATARRALTLYLGDYWQEAREVAQTLPSPDGELLTRFLTAKSAKEIGPYLMRAVREHEQELAVVSPHGQLAALRVPTFLIHGSGDPVIPSLETRYLARDVPAAALRQALITPVLSHMDVDQKLPLRAYYDVIRFVAAILDEQQR